MKMGSWEKEEVCQNEKCKVELLGPHNYGGNIGLGGRRGEQKGQRKTIKNPCSLFTRVQNCVVWLNSVSVFVCLMTWFLVIR